MLLYFFFSIRNESRIQILSSILCICLSDLFYKYHTKHTKVLNICGIGRSRERIASTKIVGRYEWECIHRARAIESGFHLGDIIENGNHFTNISGWYSFSFVIVISNLQQNGERDEKVFVSVSLFVRFGLLSLCMLYGFLASCMFYLVSFQRCDTKMLVHTREMYAPFIRHIAIISHIHTERIDNDISNHKYSIAFTILWKKRERALLTRYENDCSTQI